MSNQEKAANNQPNVVWNDDQMRSTYSNVANVGSTIEEFMLLFGTSQNWNGSNEQIDVELSDRIIMNPRAAKRLFLLLGKVLKEHEEKHGEIK